MSCLQRAPPQRAHRMIANGQVSRSLSYLIRNRIDLSPAAGEGAEQLDAAEAARIFEGQLAGALLAEDGQLALSSLASNTLSTLMPKLETQGRVGQARCAFAEIRQNPELRRTCTLGSQPAALTTRRPQPKDPGALACITMAALFHLRSRHPQRLPSVVKAIVRRCAGGAWLVRPASRGC